MVDRLIDRRGGTTSGLLRSRFAWTDMDDHEQKSCWGLTVKAVLGFVFVMALTWLVTGAESGVVLVSAG